MPWWGRWRRGGRGERSGSSEHSEQIAREDTSGGSAQESHHGFHVFALFGGRRYLADVPYALPKDDQEISRLDFQHYMLRHVFHGNYAAPLRQPRAILDVGCGTGRWAEEMALEFPHARVVGLDIVPPSVNSGPLVTGAPRQRPANYVFAQGNLFDGMPFADDSFEYVHMRFMAGAIPLTSIAATMRELMRVLAPGGWIELVEPGAFQNAGPSLAQLGAWGTELTARRGVEPSPGVRIRDWLYGAGLQNVAYRELMMPVGPHGDRLGQMATADGMAMMTALRAVVVAQGIAAPEDYDDALMGAREELMDPRRTSRVPFYFAVGQKPLS